MHRPELLEDPLSSMSIDWVKNTIRVSRQKDKRSNTKEKSQNNNLYLDKVGSKRKLKETEEEDIEKH